MARVFSAESKFKNVKIETLTIMRVSATFQAPITLLSIESPCADDSFQAASTNCTRETKKHLSHCVVIEFLKHNC